MAMMSGPWSIFFFSSIFLIMTPRAHRVDPSTTKNAEPTRPVAACIAVGI
jgi:hypothetical protein